MLGKCQLYVISLGNTFGCAKDIAKVSDEQVRRPNSALPNAWLRRKSDSESDSRARRCLVPHGALRASSARLPARCSGRPHGGCLLAGTRARWPRRGAGNSIRLVDGGAFARCGAGGRGCVGRRGSSVPLARSDDRSRCHAPAVSTASVRRLCDRETLNVSPQLTRRPRKLKLQS